MAGLLASCPRRRPASEWLRSGPDRTFKAPSRTAAPSL